MNRPKKGSHHMRYQVLLAGEYNAYPTAYTELHFSLTSHVNALTRITIDLHQIPLAIRTNPAPAFGTDGSVTSRESGAL